MSWSALLWPGSMSPGICFSFLLFVDEYRNHFYLLQWTRFLLSFYYVSYFKVYFANQNEIVDVILILQMSMECQSFNKTCFLITEWAEKVEHVISLRLHLIAQNFIVNKILQLYPAVTLGETYDRQEQRRLSRMLIKFVAFTQQWSEMNQTWEQQKADTTLLTQTNTKVEAAPVASEWSLFKTLLVRRISTWLLWPGGNTDLFVTNRLILNQNSFSFTRQNIHKPYQTMRQAFDKSKLHSTKNVLVNLIASRTTPSETGR